MTGAWAITRIGAITAAGDGAEAVHDALCHGVPLRERTPSGEDDPAAGLPAAAIAGFQPKDYIQRRGLRDLSRTSQLACVAAAPLARELEAMDAVDVGVVLGTGWGAMRPVVDFEWETCSVKPRFINPLLFAETVANVPAGQMAIFNGWSGFSLTVSCGAASGLEAIREAVQLLEEGRAPVAVAGGADEINAPMLRVLDADGVLASRGDSLPLGAGRSGIVGGEGACLLVLEAPEHAARRGAPVQAHVRAAAGRYAGASPAGASVLRELLDAAGLDAGAVDLVVSSANGSDADGEEALGLRDVFGEGESAPYVIAPKAILGETWGASGPLGVAAALGCMQRGLVPPRPHRLVPDPYLPALRMPAAATETAVRHAVVLARSDAGQLSGVLVSAPETS